MELLIVTPRFPYPTRTGDALTVFHLLKYFSERHVIDLVSCSNQRIDSNYIDAVAPYCRNLLVVPVSRFRRCVNALGAVLSRRPLQADWFYSPATARVVDRLVRSRRYDVLYAHTIRAARYLQHIQEKSEPIKILAMQISMQLNYRRIARFERNLLYRFVFRYEAARLSVYEPRVARYFDRALVISDVDRDAICGSQQNHRFFECPHGVSLDEMPLEPGDREPRSMVFSGNMNYRPNVDAATLFVQEILPRIRRRIPQAVLYIVGANPTATVRELGETDGVIVTGEVDSVYDWLRRASVGVNPLRAGAGLQNKVLEGMACGLSMVVSSVANEGIKAVPGTHLLVADSADDFSESVTSLLADPERRVNMGIRAREFIEQNWSWEVHFRRLEELLEESGKRPRAV